MLHIHSTEVRPKAESQKPSETKAKKPTKTKKQKPSETKAKKPTKTENQKPRWTTHGQGEQLQPWLVATRSRTCGGKAMRSMPRKPPKRDGRSDVTSWRWTSKDTDGSRKMGQLVSSNCDTWIFTSDCGTKKGDQVVPLRRNTH